VGFTARWRSQLLAALSDVNAASRRKPSLRLRALDCDDRRAVSRHGDSLFEFVVVIARRWHDNEGRLPKSGSVMPGLGTVA
jgi:hypothetical protein